MRNWFSILPMPARAFLGGTLLLLAVIVLSVLIGVLQNWSGQADLRDDYLARTERLRGYSEVEQDLKAAVLALQAKMERLAYPSSMSADLASAELQSALRSMAERALLTVAGSQALEPEVDASLEGFQRLAIELTLSGKPLSIDLFLQRIYEFEPSLSVRSLSLLKRPDRARRDVTAASEFLSVKAVVVALRENRQ